MHSAHLHKGWWKKTGKGQPDHNECNETKVRKISAKLTHRATLIFTIRCRNWPAPAHHRPETGQRNGIRQVHPSGENVKKNPCCLPSLIRLPFASGRSLIVRPRRPATGCFLLCGKKAQRPSGCGTIPPNFIRLTSGQRKLRLGTVPKSRTITSCIPYNKYHSPHYPGAYDSNPGTSPLLHSGTEAVKKLFAFYHILDKNRGKPAL